MAVSVAVGIESSIAVAPVRLVMKAPSEHLTLNYAKTFGIVESRSLMLIVLLFNVWKALSVLVTN